MLSWLSYIGLYKCCPETASLKFGVKLSAVSVYLANICSWRRGIHHIRTDHRIPPCWLPVNSDICRHSARSVNSARRFDICGRTEHDNAENQACHFGRTAPCQTWVDRRRVDTTVPGWCWSRRTAATPQAPLLQRSVHVQNNSRHQQTHRSGKFASSTHWHFKRLS